MSKNLGGRPTSLKDGKPYCIVLDREQRDIVLEQKGDGSISEYIRECIMLRCSSEEGKEEEVRSLKEELLKQAKQLKEYKQNEQKRSERYQADLERITTAFVLYIKRPKDPVSIRDWLMARIKNTDITLDEMYIHLRKEGFLE